MAWFVKAMERKNAVGGGPSGLWHLCAESDEGGGFFAGCDHDHPSAKEAEECIEAKKRIGTATGFPYREERQGSLKDQLIQDLHAGISRRDWQATEQAANRLRDET